MKAITKELVKRTKIDASEFEMTEKLVSLSRVVKVVKGGKNMNFRALVVVGDSNGHVGMGLGKSREVPEAIHKAGVEARKDIVAIPIVNDTIPHEIIAKYGAAKVLLKPAPPGTGVIAGGGVRAVLEASGVKDVLSKSLGSSNPVNVVRATILALASLRIPQEAVSLRKTGVRKEAQFSG
jgi:small subunit ribosomal protein S5